MKERLPIFLLLIIICMLLFSPASAVAPLDPHTQPQFVEQLPIPEVLSPTSPDHYEVTMDQVTQDVGLRDPNNLNTHLSTTVWGYNGAWPGKTIVAEKDVPITVKYINNLPTTHLLPVDHTLMGAVGTPDVKTVAHLHGGHVIQAYDGWPEWWFTSTGLQNSNVMVGGPNPYVGEGNSQTYTYKNDQNAAILWFHDHALGTTRLNVYAGLAAFYILTDPAQAALQLPTGNYDIGLAIQDRSFNDDGSLFYPSVYDPSLYEVGPHTDPLPTVSVVPEFFGDHIVVNGKIWPLLDVEPRKYRFRVLDGSTARFYNLALTGDPGFIPQMNVIGDEQGLLSAPVPLNYLLIAPGERYDVIIDFTGLAGHNVTMTNDAATPYPTGDPVDPATTGLVMQFRVGQTVTDTNNNEMPSSLVTVPKLIPDSGLPERVLQLNETFDQYGRLQQKLGPNTAAGGLDWMDPITEKPVLGSTEVWSVINPTMDTHPIHLHLVAFQIIDRRPFNAMDWKPGDDPLITGPAVPPLPEEAGWKDTAQMPPGYVTRVVAKFDLKSKYVWHCHILEHEEHDMMRPFEVIDPATDASETILLSQDTTTATIGISHTLTAKLTNENDQPIAGKDVLFSVITGPNAGLFATATSDATGTAEFTYTSSKLGKDTIIASYDLMGDPSSNPVTVEWVERVIPTPEFPSTMVPVISLSAMAVMVYALRRTVR
ncbi:MAG: multicopper oxidase domain-containing protein [Methanoregula sp.]|jgi:spore coat protein A|nr:multicopper oxidase domain-containing protein [Methanoregula sp.]